jgi:hypothetical protein
MYLIGAVVMGLYGFIYFALLNTAIPAVIFIAIILSFIPHDMMYGPQAALIAECVSPRLRYSGSSLGYHLASVVAGGPAPIIATALLAGTAPATRSRAIPLSMRLSAWSRPPCCRTTPTRTFRRRPRTAAWLIRPWEARWCAGPAGEQEHAAGAALRTGRRERPLRPCSTGRMTSLLDLQRGFPVRSSDIEHPSGAVHSPDDALDYSTG